MPFRSGMPDVARTSYSNRGTYQGKLRFALALRIVS